MKQYTNKEIITEFKRQYKDNSLYDYIYMGSDFKIEVLTNTLEEVCIRVRDMDEEGITRPSFAALCAIRDFFDTTNIDFDTDSYQGCHTCGYGGRQEIVFTIRPTKEKG